MTGPSQGNPSTDEWDKLMYSAVANRRTQWDKLFWQVPALGLTAQGFLFTVALGPSSTRMARVFSAGLLLLMTLLTIHLMARQRQADVTDAEWLEAWERQHMSDVVHGGPWQELRRKVTKGGRILVWARGYPVWVIGETLFAAAAIAILFLAWFKPERLESLLTRI